MDYDMELNVSLDGVDYYEKDYPPELWPIIRIILQYEQYLSDGFGYYSPPTKVLPRIAQRIQDEVKATRLFS